MLLLKFKEDNQHNEILKTCGTINDKVCNVVIDSCSSENIILKALVNVMGLLIEKHLALCKIGWIKKRAEIYTLTRVYMI